MSDPARRLRTAPSTPAALILLIALAVSPTALRATADEAIRTALQRAEQAIMDGDTSRAIDLFRAALERIEERGSAGASLAPEAELALRRIYDLAGGVDRYPDVLPVLLRWAGADGRDAPDAGVAGVRELARLQAGAVTLATSGDLERAREVWAPLGFLRHWWIIGPFDNERGGGFKTVYGPERDARPDPSVTHDGKNRAVSWRQLPVEPLTGWVDLDALMHPDDQALAYAMTFVLSERDMECAVHVGSDEGYRLWVNGALVASRDVHRRMRFDQDVVGIRLRAGWNSVLVKVAEDEGRWEFRMRFAAPNGGALDGWREGAPPDDAELPRTASGGESEAAPIEVAARTFDLLAKRIERDATDHWSHYVLGALHAELGAHDIGEHPDRDALRTAVTLHGDGAPSSYHYRLGQASRRERGVAADRDANAWRVALERAADAEPPSLLAMTDLARYYMTTFRNLGRAEELVVAARRANPRFGEAAVLLGQIRFRRGVPYALESAYDEAFELGLRPAAVIRHRADRLRWREPGDAEAFLRRRVALNRLDDASRHALVDLLLEIGQAEDALELLAEETRLQPFDLSARRRAVTVLRGLGRTEGALAAQRELVSVAPDDPSERRTEGDLLEQLGRRDEAMAAWKTALALQPNFPELRQYLDVIASRRDLFVEEFRRDVSDLVEAVRETEPGRDDAARYLLDLTAVEVNPDGTAKEFHQEVFRIDSERGRTLFDRYVTYYAEGDERLEFKKARVVHGDGREEDARLGVFAGGPSDTGNYRTASIDLPPLEVGDVVEVQYVREAVRQSFFGDYFGHRELFRSSYPIAEKTFVLRVPAARQFHFHQRRLDVTPQVERDAARGTVTYRWTLRDIDKVKPEPGMPPEYELLPLLEVSTFERWHDFSTWYENLIRKQFESSPEIRRKALELTSGRSTDLEKITALYEFVVQEIRYNAWEFGVHGFKPYNAPAIFARKFGDCKDKATLLTTMLAEVGIDSYPVLIRATQNRGDEDLSLPMVNHFNHCITYVPPGAGHDGMYLDGTAQYNGVTELPGSDRGARVLVVRPDGGSLETIPWNDPESIALDERMEVTINPDRSASIETRVALRGDYAAAVRSFFEIEGQRRRNLERLFGGRYPGLEINDFTFSDLSDLSVPVELRVSLRAPDFLQSAAEGLSLRPVDDFFESNRRFQGLATLDERELDVLIGTPRRCRLEVVYRLPGGYRVKSLPAAQSIEDRFGRLAVSYRDSAQEVVLTRLLETTSPRVDVEDYPEFRELTSALERLRREKVIVDGGG